MDKKHKADIASFAFVVATGFIAGTILEFTTSGGITYNGPIIGIILGLVVGRFAKNILSMKRQDK